MKKLLLFALCAIMIFSVLSLTASATETYMVVKGDSMWKIAVKYEVGLGEIKNANPHIKNPNLIYPGQTLNIPTTDASVLRFEKDVVRLVNEIRKQNGLKELTYDWQLSRVARIKSEDMRDNKYFSHTSPTYGTPFQMIKNFGITYRSAGENIARGQTTPQKVVDAWMNSSGHRANILNSSYTHIGVGYAPNGHYWTQMFIGK